MIDRKLNWHRITNDMETKKKFYRVDRREISFVKFILEGYDNIAVLSTIDPGLGIVQLTIAPGCEREVEMVLHELKNNVMIEPVPREILEGPYSEALSE